MIYKAIQKDWYVLQQVCCWLVRVVVVMGAASGQILANLTADNAATQGVRTLE